MCARECVSVSVYKPGAIVGDSTKLTELCSVIHLVYTPTQPRLPMKF